MAVVAMLLALVQVPELVPGLAQHLPVVTRRWRRAAAAGAIAAIAATGTRRRRAAATVTGAATTAADPAASAPAAGATAVPAAVVVVAAAAAQACQIVAHTVRDRYVVQWQCSAWSHLQLAERCAPCVWLRLLQRRRR